MQDEAKEQREDEEVNQQELAEQEADDDKMLDDMEDKYKDLDRKADTANRELEDNTEPESESELNNKASELNTQRDDLGKEIENFKYKHKK